jgi:endonuclease/exonuclease/phosphatase family metal-dependent hydrolase
MMKSNRSVQSFFTHFLLPLRYSFGEAVRCVFLSALLLFVLSAACEVLPADTKTKPEQTFSVASYNINFGNPNLKVIVATIRKANPDIIALQETNKQSATYLKRKLGKLYPHIRFHHAPWAGGFGFLSKVPFRKVTYIKPSKGPFGTYLVKVQLGGKTIEIANLHLCPTVPGKKDTLKTFLQRVLKTQTRRIKEIFSIYPKLSKKIPRLVVGDFNSLGGTFVPLFLEGKGMVDSYKAVTPASKRKETWHWKINNYEWKFRIDYIFHSKVFKTVSSKIFRSDGSDHYLIHSKLTLRQVAEKKDVKKKSAAKKAKKTG